MRIFEPNLVFRLAYVSGEVFYADYLLFEPAAAVESQSWGAIKSLFR